jgi:hypothetical protein
MALNTRPTISPGTIQPQDPAELAMIPSAPAIASMSIMSMPS